MLLVLSFVLSVIPFGVLANDTDTITKWSGLLYEGKFSVTADVSAEPDVFFAGSGIGDDGDLSSASYYHAYISGSTLTVDKYTGGEYVETLGTAVVTATGSVTLSVAYSLKGAIYCWINGERVIELSGCTPYGAEIAYDDATSGFAIVGGLEWKQVAGTVTYDSKKYEISTSAANSWGYFTNRYVTNGKLIFTSKAGSGIRGPIIGVTHTSGKTTWEGAGVSYYLVDINGNRICLTDKDGRTDVSALTTTSGTKFQTNNNGQWVFGSNLGEAINTVDFNIGTTLATIVLNGASKTVTATDSDPIQGGYYGLRAPNSGTKVGYYVVNNEVEAMDIDIVSASTGIKVGETGTVVVKTVPAGSVINSGDSIEIAGNGISQVGEAVDNGDGTYTLTYEAIASGETAITASVDNHIYGTLSDATTADIELPDTGITRWDGLLYEGKFSVKLDTSASYGVYFAANGIDVAGHLNAASYYHAYIENSVLKVDKYENGALVGNVGEKSIGVNGDVILSVAYSLKGAVSCWINDDRTLDLSGCTPYGTQIAYDNEATDFAIVGGLKLVNTGSQNATYDADSYTFTISGNKTVAHFSNRNIKNGYIVYTVPSSSHPNSCGGPVFGMYNDGTNAGNNNNTTHRAFYMVDARTTQYRFIVVDYGPTIENSITDETTYNSYVTNRFTGYTFGYNASSKTGWMFGSGTGAYAQYGEDTNVIINFNIGSDIASISTGKKAFTDNAPINGGYYGVYSEAAANTTYTLHAVNNEVEAMDIDFTGIAFNETTGVYTATLTTFPAGSVINSGDYIKVTGANLEQIGEMTDLGNGVYTVQFKTTATGEATAQFSVDNHIYGTLTASHTQEFVAHEHTGEFDGDNDNHWIDCGCGEQIELGAHDKTGATEKVEPDCTTEGTRSYVTCPTCKITLYLKDDGTWAILENDADLVIPATGHVNTTPVAQVDATCMAEGKLAHDKCACGALLLDGEVVDESDLIIAKDANAHTGNNTTDYDGEYHWDVCECGATVSEKVAHTYANGKDGACTAGCGYTKDHVCVANDHVAPKVPTCIEGGNVEYWTCECGAKYLDEACTEIAGDVELGVDPENHVIDIETAPWISDANNHWKACTCGAELNKGAHDGLDCTICGNKTVGVYKNGEDLYYIESTGRHATGKIYVSEDFTNGHVTEGWYYADNTGKFIKADFFDDNGTIRYVVDGKTVYTRVTEIGGKLYMVDWDGVVLTGKFYITADSAQGLTEEGWHYTNPDGSFIVDGFFTDGEVIRYVRNGMTVYTGITKINGQFYMIDFDGEVKTDKFYVTEEATNGHVKSGWYYADENGNFLNETFYMDGNVKRYIVNGQGAYTRVTEIDGDYYMIEWDGVVVINTEKFYITESSTKGQFKGGWYKTDENGKIIL